MKAMNKICTLGQFRLSLLYEYLWKLSTAIGEPRGQVRLASGTDVYGTVNLLAHSLQPVKRTALRLASGLRKHTELLLRLSSALKGNNPSFLPSHQVNVASRHRRNEKNSFLLMYSKFELVESSVPLQSAGSE